MESQGSWLRELWLRHGRTRRPAASSNGDRASARPDSLVGPHPCRHPVGSLPRRRCRRWTGRAGGACRGADRRSIVVDRSLEDGARQRVLTPPRGDGSNSHAIFRGTPMTHAQFKSPPPRLARAIVQRTRGRTHGPVTRLMSPSDVGEILKPFVFLDLFDHDGALFNGPLPMPAGIAPLVVVAEGAVSYIDPDNVRGTLPAGGVEWMQAGRGMWHGGGLDKAGRTRGFQLWIALPPELELGPTISVYQAPEDVPQDGPARVLLGGYGSASSAIASPSPINYLAVRLKAGERWRYEPPTDHTVLWVAIASGVLSEPDELRHGDLAAFEPSSKAVEFEALTDAEFVLGSAAPPQRHLVSGLLSCSRA